MEYEGDNRFTMTSSENSKLSVGDDLEFTDIFVGMPLYIPVVKRGGEKMPPFVAGRSSGITFIQKRGHNA